MPPAPQTPKKLLSDAMVKKISAAGSGKREIIWDSQQPGFGLRIGATGAVSWIAKYRIGRGRGGDQKLVTLGSPPALSAEDARFKAGQLVTEGRKNVDLYAKWQEEDAARKQHYEERQLEAFGSHDPRNPAYLKTAWDTAIALKINPSKRYKRNLERIWKHVGTETIKTSEMTTEKILEIRKKLEGKPAEFNKFRAFLYTVLENEVYERRLDKNPLERIKQHTPKYREAILSEKGVAEFKKFFSNLENFPENRWNFARYMLALLYTGQRPTMLRSLRQRDDGIGNYVDWDRQMLVFRQHKTAKKSTAAASEIPISNEAFAVLKAAARMNPECPFVFAAPDHRAGFRDLAISEKRTQEFFKSHAHRFDKEGSEPLVLYSLRHTFGSILVNKGVPLVQVSKLMLHTSTLTTERYVKTTKNNRAAAVAQIDNIFGAM